MAFVCLMVPSNANPDPANGVGNINTGTGNAPIGQAFPPGSNYQPYIYKPYIYPPYTPGGPYY